MRTYRNFIMAKSDLRYPLFRKQPNAIGGIAKTVGYLLTTPNWSRLTMLIENDKIHQE